MKELVLWGEKIPKSYTRIRKNFDGFIKQIERHSEKRMVSYVDSDLNQLYRYILRNKRFFSKKDTDKLKKILDNIVADIWTNT